MVPTHETPLRAAKEPQAHLRHSGNRCGSRYLSGRTTTRSQRHQDNRPLLSPPRFVRAEKSAAGMGKTHHRSRVAFRNPFRAEHELESGLPHRLGRQDASSRIPRQSPQHRLERGERVGGVTDSQTPSRFGGGVRGTLRRNIQFEHRIAWRRSAGGAAHHRLAFLGKDDSKRKRGMGRRLYHGATCLGERHSTRNRHGKTLYQDVIPANPAK